MSYIGYVNEFCMSYIHLVNVFCKSCMNYIKVIKIENSIWEEPTTLTNRPI